MLIFLTTAAQGQWIQYRDPEVPRLPDGSPNLMAPTSKTADGKPNLSGVWIPAPDPDAQRGGVENGTPPKYFVSLAGGFNPGNLPMQPWAAELFGQRMARQAMDQPTTSCQPAGTPWRAAFPVPYKIVQTPRLIILLYELDTVFRQIFVDGRSLPDDPQPSYLGYSVGRWEGETLVVTTTGFKDQGWLDGMGHPYTGALRMEERFRRTNTGHMDLQVTINDPAAYTAPLTYTQPQILLPDTDVMEDFCAENEKDQPHLVAN
jgi:hypothetical protein